MKWEPNIYFLKIQIAMSTLSLGSSMESNGANAPFQGQKKIVDWLKKVGGVRIMLFTTLLSLLMSVGGIECALGMSAGADSMSTFPVVTVLLIWLGSYLIAAVAVGFILVASVKQKRPMLTPVIACFLSILLVFAGIYYSMACLGDYNDAVVKMVFYSKRYYDPERDLPLSESQRAFRGIENRRWAGLELLAMQKRSAYLQPQDVQGVPLDDLRTAAASLPKPEAVSNTKDLIPLLVDCLHFSTVTITTLGYGDISPQTWYAKMAADLEVLSGVFIVAISVGTYFSRINLPPSA